MTSPSSMTQPSLLNIPEELRLIIYSHLFQSEHSIKVESALEGGPLGFDDLVEDDSPRSQHFRMPAHAHPLSSQLLRTNKQILSEAKHVLYSTNTFDCTTRDGIQLLSSSFNSECFSHIASLVLDWHQLLDFSFQLAKPEFVEKTRNLTIITLAYWRTRILGGSSILWLSVKSNESTVLRAARAICEKSAKLALVAQHPWAGKMRPLTDANRHVKEQQMSRSDRTATSSRVKWRFLASENQMWPTEKRVDLEVELRLLESHGRNAEGEFISPLAPLA